MLDRINFGDENAKAIDTSWYKRAVDQHQIESDSFVFSVPFDSGYTSKNNVTLVTAAHAIFIEHKGHKAPAAVVGLQFQHDSLARHFINITSAVSRWNCFCNSINFINAIDIAVHWVQWWCVSENMCFR